MRCACILLFCLLFKPGTAQVSAPAHKPSKFMLKVLPDADCTIFIDGVSKGKVQAGEIWGQLVAKGTYTVKAVGNNPSDVVSQQYTVQGTNVDPVLKLYLNDVINARLQKEDATLKDSDPAAAIKNIPMVLVPGGTFTMGDSRDFNSPPHKVTLSSFYIGKTEVTQAQWLAVMGDNPSYYKNGGSCPVESISWDAAQAFIVKLNQLSGKHYRLPTEAEWEYAARGGNKSKGYTYSGSNKFGDIGWCHNNSEGDKTHAAGLKQPNELGLYDMTGNVSEWCQDFYDVNYYRNSPVNDPQGPATGSTRVRRGGNWFYDAKFCYVTNRDDTFQTSSDPALGIRLILTP